MSNMISGLKISFETLRVIYRLFLHKWARVRIEKFEESQEDSNVKAWNSLGIY